MTGEHRETQARRVVAGLSEDGRSTIVSDDIVSTRVVTDAFTVNQIWQFDSLPPDVLVDDASGGEVSIAPPVGGFVHLITSFPPDSEYDAAAAYAEALAASGNAGAHVEGEIAGLHQTDTVDIITVISGELYAVLEDGEVQLKPGDCFVQRGTKHVWSNRSDVPCVIAAVMVGATR